MKNKSAILAALLLAMAGLGDSIYLTYEHYAKVIPPCSVTRIFYILFDCGQVLLSSYSLIFGQPIAILGIIHYGFLAMELIVYLKTRSKFFAVWMILEMVAGAFASAYFMCLQLFVIKSLCLYCTLSAAISFALFGFIFILRKERIMFFIYPSSFIYRNIIKKIFFLFNPEFIHERMTDGGELLGKIPFLPKLIAFALKTNAPVLSQTIAGIHFESPVGLAAGFDYRAQLTEILPQLGFGFGTIGTITNEPYGGNKPPRLGRLPKSKSLMVNKGFKNPGADHVIAKLEEIQFTYPVGISIGATNKDYKSSKAAVLDILETFRTFEKSKVNNAYYELNISCPNLKSTVNFYHPNELRMLLAEVVKLKIKKPIFIKMPIDKTDRETLIMLKVISENKIQGVIFGNLQKNRKDPALDPDEVKRFSVGNFSGKPTEKRSNELISLTYKNYSRRFVIIGCGGIFSMQDAYEKIRRGASLVQLITGMIYQGPQLVAQINLELAEKLEKEGLLKISDIKRSPID